MIVHRVRRTHLHWKIPNTSCNSGIHARKCRRQLEVVNIDELKRSFHSEFVSN